MTDYAGWQVGNVQLPLTSSTANSALRDADPALFYALDFFGAMIATHLAPRLVAEASRSPAIAPVNAAASGYAMRVPFDPAPWMTQDQLDFPLLAVYRKSAKSNYVSTVYSHDDSEWGLAYVLPPLTAAQFERLQPLLSVAAKVVSKAAEQGWYPGYVPPGGSADLPQVWSAAYANVEKVYVNAWRWGGYEGTGNLYFPALLADVSLVERSTDVRTGPNAPAAFAGADVDEQVGSAAGSPLDAVVQINTAVTPPNPGG